jgi:hypothetical protein
VHDVRKGRLHQSPSRHSFDRLGQTRTEAKLDVLDQDFFKTLQKLILLAHWHLIFSYGMKILAQLNGDEGY